MSSEILGLTWELVLQESVGIFLNIETMDHQRKYCSDYIGDLEFSKRQVLICLGVQIFFPLNTLQVKILGSQDLSVDFFRLHLVTHLYQQVEAEP